MKMKLPTNQTFKLLEYRLNNQNILTCEHPVVRVLLHEMFYHTITFFAMMNIPVQFLFKSENKNNNIRYHSIYQRLK